MVYLTSNKTRQSCSGLIASSMAVKYLEIYLISIILKFARSLLKTWGSGIISNIFSTGPDKSVSKLVDN